MSDVSNFIEIQATEPTTGDKINLTVELTFNHALSDHGAPVMMVREWHNEPMSCLNWILGNCVVVKYGNIDQKLLFDQWLYYCKELFPSDISIQFKCFQCGAIQPFTDLIYDKNSLTGEECFMCCSYCGTWLDIENAL